MKYFIYFDESAEASFSKNSIYNYFTICSLTVEENLRNKIKNTMRRKKAKLYKLGWPKNKEIKASVLHSMRYQNDIPELVKSKINGDEFIMEILCSLKSSCAFRIDYFAVDKNNIKRKTFRNSPYGIAYNYFASKLLIPLALAYKDCYLTVDKRNKEVHNLKHFDGYILTRIKEEEIEKDVEINIDIEHAESISNYGLQAVDFFSWSVYRKIANSDTRFFEIFEERVNIGNEWYCK